MPYINIYTDLKHFQEYKDMTDAKKKELNSKLRKLMYRELDNTKR